MQWNEIAAGYLHELVYKLSKIGQAIDNNDLSASSSVLGGSIDTDWVKNANLAFSKVTNIFPHNVCVLILANLIPLHKAPRIENMIRSWISDRLMPKWLSTFM
ncbi:hypothetical protein DITRI_Ditri10aG0152900 [Diplodiscus trichospermus]